MQSTYKKGSTEHTPNWPNKEPDASDRYTSITISVKISCNGRGVNRQEVEKICARIERTAKNRSTSREVSALV